MDKTPAFTEPMCGKQMHTYTGTKYMRWPEVLRGTGKKVGVRPWGADLQFSVMLLGPPL